MCPQTKTVISLRAQLKNTKYRENSLSEQLPQIEDLENNVTTLKTEKIEMNDKIEQLNDLMNALQIENTRLKKKQKLLNEKTRIQTSLCDKLEQSKKEDSELKKSALELEKLRAMHLCLSPQNTNLCSETRSINSFLWRKLRGEEPDISSETLRFIEEYLQNRGNTAWETIFIDSFEIESLKSLFWAAHRMGKQTLLSVFALFQSIICVSTDIQSLIDLGCAKMAQLMRKLADLGEPTEFDDLSELM